jgi:uncharacterized protein
MDSGKLLGRGIAFPPHLGSDGRWSWSSGPDNIRDAIEVILLTERGERLMLPEFGGSLSAYLFEPNTTTTRSLLADSITNALQAWEPRIRVEGVRVEPDPEEAQAAIATITYHFVATGGRQQTTLRVNLSA